MPNNRREEADIAKAKVLADALLTKENSVYNREMIDLFFKENRDQHEDIKRILTSVDDRVAIANGKVSEISKWKEKAVGGLYIVSFLGFTGFVGLVLWWIKLFT
jgi:hypothetical protein